MLCRRHPLDQLAIIVYQAGRKYSGIQKEIEKMDKIMKWTTKNVLTRYQRKIKASKYASTESNALDRHIEPPFEENPHLLKNDDGQNEINFENIGVENADNSTMHNTMQTNGNTEDAMEIDRAIEDVDGNRIMKKKSRGPTKVRRLPSDPLSRIEVKFNAVAKPIGAGSGKLSSYLGPLVREHVQFALEDLRLFSDELSSCVGIHSEKAKC